MIRAFDFDGTLVNVLDKFRDGDIIITGRCIDEAPYVYGVIIDMGLPPCPIYFNPILLKDRGNHTEDARRISALHKINILEELQYNGVVIEGFYEDDALQAKMITDNLNTNVIMVDNKGEVEL